MPGSIRRILLVDDEPLVLKLLANAFRDAGYEVKAASNASDAIALCESESCNVLLSDVRMPGMDGHELARWFAVRHPGVRRLLMSGYDELECSGCGVAGEPCTLIQKPFRPRNVVAIVDKLLEGGDESLPLPSLRSLELAYPSLPHH